MLLEKSWHALDNLFNKLANQINNGSLTKIIAGDIQIGPDIGCGPAISTSPEDVSAVADAIKQIEEKDLKKFYDSDDMMKQNIYPTIWDRGKDGFDFAVYSLSEPKEYF